jgi:hypothetical protein
MTARRRLPHRRGAVALDIEHAGHRYRMHVGYFPEGAVGEVFLDATKQNSMLDAFVADAAILLSLVLQHGALPAEIGHALRRSPNDAPASLIGAVVDAAIRWDSSPGNVINAPVAGAYPIGVAVRGAATEDATCRAGLSNLPVMTASG